MAIIARNTPAFEASATPEDQLKTAVNSPDSWQQELAAMIRTAEELVAYVGLPASFIDDAWAGQRQFPVKVTRHYADRIVKGDPSDPLLLQVLPLAAETIEQTGYNRDPLAEQDFQAGRGILHKYRGRALLITTGSCAIHCRYCFRRHFPYQEHRLSRKEWDQSLQYIAGDTSIEEIILSGGDPLMLTDDHLEHLIGRIEQMAHITTLRLHTRLPVVLPSRLTDRLLQRLESSRLQVVVVIHANHPNEIDATVGAALLRLGAHTHSVLNQTVLLKGINARSEVLIELSKTLFSYRVLPYYLHLLDKVEGAAHFDTDEDSIGPLMAALRGRLPGYLVPKPVREMPGASSKSPVWV